MSAARRALPLAASIALASLAGCLDRDGAEEGAGGATLNATTATDESSDAPPPTVPGATRVHFAAGEAASETIWSNGTFTIEQAGWPIGVLTQGALMGDNPRRIDITAAVPQGVPTLVTVEVDASVGAGDVDIWLDAPEIEIWSGVFDTPFGGWSRFEMSIVHVSSESIAVVLGYDEHDDQPSFDYTLRIDVASDPSLLLPGVAVGVPMGPGDALHLEPLDAAKETNAALYDPADAHLGRVRVAAGAPTLALAADAPAGEYVVMLSGDASPARASLTGPSLERAAGRVLAQTFREGAPVPIDGADEVRWTFDEATAPLQVFVGIVIDGAMTAFSGSVASPTGSLFDFAFQGPDVAAGFAYGMRTMMGAEGLVPGTYTVAITPQAAVQASAWELVVYYER